MVLFSILASMLFSCRLHEEYMESEDCANCSIHGEDSRVGLEDVDLSDPKMVDVVRSIGGLVDKNLIDKESTTIRELHGHRNLCPEIKFLDLPKTYKECSCVLVSNQHVVTAAHCILPDFCDSNVIAFDEYADSGELLNANGSIFECERVLFNGWPNYDGQNVDTEGHSKDDFALLKLKVPASDRPHVKIDWSPFEAGTEVAFLGHQGGLPLIYSEGSIKSTQESQSWVDEVREEYSDSELQFVLDFLQSEGEGMIPYDAPILGGDSGGLLFKKDNPFEALGIHSSAVEFLYGEWIAPDHLTFYYSETKGCYDVKNCKNDDLGCPSYNRAVPFSKYKDVFEEFGVINTP